MTDALRIEVSALARRQIAEADRWWRANRGKAPDEIREDFNVSYAAASSANPDSSTYPDRRMTYWANSALA